MNLQQVQHHTLTIIHDQGLNRHIRFKKPNTGNQCFDLITWPGHLLITGDMGSYLFKRLDDMFQFFRTGRWKINPAYWGEKLQAIDRHNGYREWDREKFKAAITETFNEWLDENAHLDPDALADAKHRFEEDIFQPLDDCTKDDAYRVARDFEVDDICLFQDFWEVNTDSFTYHYLWACYAIVWGIQQYDAQHPAVPA